MQKVSFIATQVEMAEVRQNDIYMSVLMRMFSTRPNRNGFAVSEAFIDNIVANAPKYTCLPQCADAERLRRGDTQGQTHMLDGETGKFESEQIGSFFSFAKANDQFGASLIGEARIPKRDPALCETILGMYETGRLSFSFEILVSTMTQQGEIFVIDAAEGNEQIGMAVVSTPAYPEATALKLVAENEESEKKEDTAKMDENQKRIAEQEAQLKLAEQERENDEELRKRDEQLEEEKRKREQAEAELTVCRDSVAQKDARIAELEAQVAELTPVKAEVEQLRKEKADAELAAKRKEMTQFAERQGLDVKSEAVAKAIEAADYAALVAESLKQQPMPGTKPVMASYAMANGMSTKGEYDDLLGKA